MTLHSCATNNEDKLFPVSGKSKIERLIPIMAIDIIYSSWLQGMVLITID